MFDSFQSGNIYQTQDQGSFGGSIDLPIPGTDGTINIGGGWSSGGNGGWQMSPGGGPGQCAPGYYPSAAGGCVPGIMGVPQTGGFKLDGMTLILIIFLAFLFLKK